MGEAIAVDGSGSPPSAQIIFSAIDEGKRRVAKKKRERKVRKAGREGERETVRDAVTGRPGEPPPPLRKPLKTYPVLSDLSRSPSPPCAPPRAQEFPTLPPKSPKALPKAEEDKKFF